MMIFALAVNFVLFMSTSVNSFLNLNGWILPSSAQVPASVFADLVLFPTNPTNIRLWFLSLYFPLERAIIHSFYLYSCMTSFDYLIIEPPNVPN